MKYDFSRCNNLRWQITTSAGECKTGFVKLANNAVYLYNDGLFATDAYTRLAVRTIYGSAEVDKFYNVFKEDFRIIPRNPNCYYDWQVGDNFKMKNLCHLGQVMATCGKIIAIKWAGKKEVEWLLKSWVDANCELLLTDYEKYIRDLGLGKKPVYNFEEGDKVLVRDSDDQEWEFCIFEKIDVDNIYWANQCEWKQCIPLNEHTWHLLGTKDAYKEEK